MGGNGGWRDVSVLNHIPVVMRYIGTSEWLNRAARQGASLVPLTCRNEAHTAANDEKGRTRWWDREQSVVQRDMLVTKQAALQGDCELTGG